LHLQNASYCWTQSKVGRALEKARHRIYFPYALPCTERKNKMMLIFINVKTFLESVDNHFMKSVGTIILKNVGSQRNVDATLLKKNVDSLFIKKSIGSTFFN
jgi:hypothetical protein